MTYINEPAFVNHLPNSDDFYYDGGMDEEWNRDHYLGKDIDFMLKQLKNGCALSIMGDFYLVGTIAFRYYAFAIFRYIQEVVETENEEMLFESSGLLSCVTDCIEHHMKINPGHMIRMHQYLDTFFDWAEKHYDVFEIDEEIYGDLRPRWTSILEAMR